MDLLGQIIGLGRDLIGRLLPNPEDELKRQQMILEFQGQVMAKQADIQIAAADIVKTEAASTHWLTATWRPLLMLTFGALIVMRLVAAMFGVQFVGVSPAEWDHLWSIIELGIGGYVVGRSGEKITSLLKGGKQ